MWRKIHSNRDPRDTLFSELKKEFQPYVVKGVGRFRSAATKYPRLLFAGMIVALLISLALSFTIFREHEQVVTPVVKSLSNPGADGFEQIMQATGKIRETIKLKHLVDSLTAEKQLSKADTLLLDSALDRLQQIHHTLK
ncbi:hypothetical protein [Mucilaginibacter glaciei]|uniref:Uncharacterized protein n=1 Tax=Mucilaginibacter glaciei TaxID=2772109 RepID=A0A926S2J1_9SPHI|nr:hypothetical protein [Mucilaginibacter glaciei]MBD1395170.1 hypothetical protein [Mucilaginibacter glaciei]